jgi:hypothetical protein
VALAALQARGSAGDAAVAATATMLAGARGFLTLATAGCLPLTTAGVLLIQPTGRGSHLFSTSAATAAAAAAAAAAGAGSSTPSFAAGASAPALRMTNRMKLAWEKRKRRWNAISPLHAFVYFRESGAAAASTAEPLRMLGIVINKQASRTEPAADKRTLYVGSLARGQTPYAVALSLTLMLDALGYQVALSDASRLRHGMLCNGEAFIEFPSHAEAVRAAHWLQSGGVAGSAGGGAGSAVGRGSVRGKLVVGFATEDEWRRAAPKAVYF